MKYLSEGHTLPMVICNWLETAQMQDEFKQFISYETDQNKSSLLINCLKLKGITYIELVNVFLYYKNYCFSRKYCV